jgi:glycyl-tRNA synthetase
MDPGESCMNKKQLALETLASLCKRRGFIYQSSEIYGGLSGFWDYGPLGAELKRNIKETWWNSMTRMRDDVVGLEASIIMHPTIWKASGHLDTFSDPMSMCKHCKKLLRADQVLEMMEDNSWSQTLADMCPDNKPDLHKLANWAKGKGKGQAPNLALIRNPDATLAGLTERMQNPEPLTLQDIYRYLGTEQAGTTGTILPCPICGGELTEPRPFNLMFKTIVGPVEDPANVAYLRPETAQAIFVQFKNVLESSRQQVPFGIAQMGKSFRNEVTPRNYTFRSREFEQMELEFFIRPDEAVELICGRVTTLADQPDINAPQPDWGWEVWHKHWVEQRMAWYRSIGLPAASLVEYWQTREELAHYARACVDIQFAFPFGTQELEGIAARSDFDLGQHQKFSGKTQEVFDDTLKAAATKLDAPARDAFTAKVTAQWQANGKTAEAAIAFCNKLFEGKYIPHVIEPSAGADRLALALLCNAYTEEWVPTAGSNAQPMPAELGKQPPAGYESRIAMRFSPRIAPVKVAVFPLMKNKPELMQKAKEVFEMLRKRWFCFWDESGAIGRRYRRQDEAGTPFCVTIDFDTLQDNTVTLRNRDSMKQTRINITNLAAELEQLMEMATLPTE